MKNLLSSNLLIILFCTIALYACAEKRSFILSSPNGSLTINLKTPKGASGAQYNISFNGTEVVHDSDLGFEFSDNSISDKEVTIGKVKTKSINDSWKPVYGERNEYPDIYNEALVSFDGNDTYTLRIRAYDEGIAFRYEFIEEKKEIVIASENTEFNIGENASAWVSTRAQSEISKVKISDINEAKERPMLIQHSDDIYLAIGEAALVDYARMKLINRSSGSGVLKSDLEGEVKHKDRFSSPWRFVMAANQPGQLLENNYLLLNLNEPNKIKDTS